MCLSMATGTCSEVSIASAAGVQKVQLNLDFYQQNALHNHNASVLVSDLIFYSVKNVVLCLFPGLTCNGKRILPFLWLEVFCLFIIQ